MNLGRALCVTVALACGACARRDSGNSNVPAQPGYAGGGPPPSGSAYAPPPKLPPPPPPVPPAPTGYGNSDPNDDLIVGPPAPWPDCAAMLAKEGVKYRAASLPVITTKNGRVCGAPEVITYERGPMGLSYTSPPVLTCGMALALAAYERLVVAVSMEVFGVPVTRIDHMGTYACRDVAAQPGLISEHSYANALDVASFTLKNGKQIIVLKDFELAEPPTTPAGKFLRLVSRRAFDEIYFSVVLTPFFNEAHKNHFHLDLARYRSDGTRPL